ncbi:hypothetical protein ABT382_37670 [Streptomyces pharetrae]|uniref:Uncharacterized protein n=1 Tax=Streptomyces pharetrae CZA14 TaxID=1144883 RepID=A0ABX3Y7D9_9ACTN|nr:hypothetical protein OQI_38600 [Streptomyces pharetrae CZA14]
MSTLSVFDDLLPDLERLLTLRVWHAMWLERIDRKIAAVERAGPSAAAVTEYWACPMSLELSC